MKIPYDVSMAEHVWRMQRQHWGLQKNVYHANVTNYKKIGRYTKNFPVKIVLQTGTKKAVMEACRKYLGQSYLGMKNYQIVVHKEGTWIYHNGILYLKNPADESVITLGMLTK